MTPLDPRAGPTGGLGLACPAPTISLTICSLARGGLGAMAQKKSSGKGLRWSGEVVVSFVNISLFRETYFSDWA